MKPERTNHLLLAMLLGATPLLGACAANGAGMSGTGDGDDPPANQIDLEVLGPSSRELNEFAEHKVEVRYVRNGDEPIQDATVDFAIEGSAGGATLSGSAAPTNDEGIASITLRAGSPASYELVAVAPHTEPAKVNIDVRAMRFGTLDYTVTYPDGERVIEGVEAALFTNTSCEEIRDERVPSPREVQSPRVDEMKTFDEVERGVPMAIFALGIDSGDFVAADGCKNVTLESPENHVEVSLQDIPETVGGTYEVKETFDVTDGFSSSIDGLLETMRGLSEDPATYIVDFVAEHDEAPDWLKDALSFGPTRTLVISELDNLLSRVHPPGFVTETLDIGAELDRGLSGMTLRGDLTFEGPDEFGQAPATHRVDTVELPVMDGDPVTRPVSAEADMTISVGDTISLPEHELGIVFGSLVEMLLNDVLLPRAPGSPASMREAVKNVFDCEAFARELADDGSTTADLAESVCNVGTNLVAERIEHWITNLWNYEVLHLQGSAKLQDTDGDYDRDTISDGTSMARWTGESGELSFPGTMTGHRVDDTTGRNHRVRDRLHGLR